jgi:hypothetical protein
VVDPAELADDGRQGRTDDGLIQRGQQDAGHQPAHEQQKLPPGQDRSGDLVHGAHRAQLSHGAPLTSSKHSVHISVAIHFATQ